MHGAFFIIDKEINKDVVKLDERYFLYLEDIDFCILMQNYGKIGVATLANATHKHDRASRRSLQLTILHLKAFCKFWIKHGFFTRRRC